MLKIIIIKLIFFVGLATFTTNTFSQRFINMKRSKVMKFLMQDISNRKSKIIIKETDSTILFLARDSNFRKLDATYHFDENNKCDVILTVVDCDSCLQILLNDVLSYSWFKWKWTKLTDRLYVTRSSERMSLEILDTNNSTANNYGYIIRREKRQDILKYKKIYQK